MKGRDKIKKKKRIICNNLEWASGKKTTKNQFRLNARL